MGLGAAPRKLRFRYTATRHPRSTFRDGTRIPNTSRAPPREPQNLHTQLPHPRPPKNHRQPPTSGHPRPPAPAYLPTLLTRSPILLRFYRLAISQYLIKGPSKRLQPRAPFFSNILGPDHRRARRTLDAPGRLGQLRARAGPRARWVVDRVVAPDVLVRLRGARAQAGRLRVPGPPLAAREAPPARDRVCPLRLPARLRLLHAAGPDAAPARAHLLLRLSGCWRCGGDAAGALLRR